MNDYRSSQIFYGFFLNCITTQAESTGRLQWKLSRSGASPKTQSISALGWQWRADEFTGLSLSGSY